MHYQAIINHYPEDAQWKHDVRSGRTIDAIKHLRAVENCPLKEAKEIVCMYAKQANRDAHDATTTHATLPNGATLTVINNGHYAAITVSRNVALNVPPECLAQAIADAVAEFGID